MSKPNNDEQRLHHHVHRVLLQVLEYFSKINVSIFGSQKKNVFKK